MCGIYFYSGKKCGSHYTKYEYLKENGNRCIHRGPDKSCELYIYDSINEYFFLFHRLSINGLSKKGDQPFYKKNVALMCNGEIYNYRELIDKYNLDKDLLYGHSDCEVIIDLYLKIGIDECIKNLDGVFSFVLYDKTSDNIIIGHDPIGVRSLYWSNSKDKLFVSSELKSLHDLETKVDMFPNGSYSIINLTKPYLLKISNSLTHILLLFSIFHTRPPCSNKDSPKFCCKIEPEYAAIKLLFLLGKICLL